MKKLFCIFTLCLAPSLLFAATPVSTLGGNLTENLNVGPGTTITVNGGSINATGGTIIGLMPAIGGNVITSGGLVTFVGAGSNTTITLPASGSTLLAASAIGVTVQAHNNTLLGIANGTILYQPSSSNLTTISTSTEILKIGNGTYTGNSSITTTGTILTGAWNGTIGGFTITGNTSGALNQIQVGLGNTTIASISFLGQPNTGIYQTAAGRVSVLNSGINTVEFLTSGLYTSKNITVDTGGTFQVNGSFMPGSGGVQSTHLNGNSSSAAGAGSLTGAFGSYASGTGAIALGRNAIADETIIGGGYGITAGAESHVRNWRNSNWGAFADIFGLSGSNLGYGGFVGRPHGTNLGRGGFVLLWDFNFAAGGSGPFNAGWDNGEAADYNDMNGIGGGVFFVTRDWSDSNPAIVNGGSAVSSYYRAYAQQGSAGSVKQAWYRLIVTGNVVTGAELIYNDTGFSDGTAALTLYGNYTGKGSGFAGTVGFAGGVPANVTVDSAGSNFDDTRLNKPGRRQIYYGGQGTGNANGGNLTLGVALPGASGPYANTRLNVFDVSGSDGAVHVGGNASITALTKFAVHGNMSADKANFGSFGNFTVSANATHVIFANGTMTVSLPHD